MFVLAYEHILRKVKYILKTNYTLLEMKTFMLLRILWKLTIRLISYEVPIKYLKFKNAS